MFVGQRWRAPWGDEYTVHELRAADVVLRLGEDYWAPLVTETREAMATTYTCVSEPGDWAPLAYGVRGLS